MPDQPDTPFADRLRRAREAAGCTQKDIADHFDYDRSAVAKWESGDRIPRQYLQDAVLDWLHQQEGQTNA